MGYYSDKLFISSSKFIILAYSLLLLLMIPFAFSYEDSKLGSYCSDSSFTAGSSYSLSVSYVLEDLNASTAFNHSGFRNASCAQDKEWAYGLALCRGDVSLFDCDTCIKQAITDLNNSCPYGREAVIVRQLCLLKYSDIDFLREIDYEVYYSTEGTSYRPLSDYGFAAVGLLADLFLTVVGAPKFFAIGTTVAVGANDTLVYGMVQCTRDLSVGDCKECLNNVTSGLVSCYWELQCRISDVSFLTK